MGTKFVDSFDKLDINKINLIGCKASNIVFLFKNEYPIPYGFCINTKAFDHFINYNKLDGKISLVMQHNRNINSDELNELKKIILSCEIPSIVKDEIILNFQNLCNKYKNNNLLVSVRSSSTHEDSKNMSFAGLYSSFLNISEENLLMTIKKCWASLFNNEAILYQKIKNVSTNKMAVIVQKMINADKAGVILTEDPIKKDKNIIIIEGLFGLGINTVSGTKNPHRYLVNKNDRNIVMSSLMSKGEIFLRKSEIEKIISIASEIENIFNSAQEIEWAIENDSLYILQSRYLH